MLFYAGPIESVIKYYLLLRNEKGKNGEMKWVEKG